MMSYVISFILCPKPLPVTAGDHLCSFFTGSSLYRTASQQTTTPSEHDALRMKYLFGPVNSRRLGRSLGIDLIPGRICNFNCIYCEAGAKQLVTMERRIYSPVAAILAELEPLVADPEAAEGIDCITLTASGEPTLHRGVGGLIRGIRQFSDKKIVVLTNGSLLHLAEVRTDLALADVVIPSLDAALPDSFTAINRPAAGADLATIIDGLALFCREFPAEVWLEVLLAQGINDRPEDIAALGRAIEKIQPDRVQLNTVVRPPLDQSALPLDRRSLEKIARELPGRVEIIASFQDTDRKNFRPADCNAILEMLRRRPCTTEDIRQAIGCTEQEISQCLSQLTDAGRIERISHGGGCYHRVIDHPKSPAT